MNAQNKSIDDYSLINFFLKRFYTKNIKVHRQADDLTQILKRYPKLVCAINHGPSPAPFAAFTGIVDNYIKSGGSERKPIIIAWRGFYKVPIIRRLISYMTQADHGMTAEEFMQRMEKDGYTDLFVMPEGENCMFGDGDEIVSFLSPKFVEFALRLNVPILVVTHSGTEAMSTPFTFTGKDLNRMKWLPKRYFKTLSETHTLSFPHFGEHDIDQLSLHFKLHKPILKLEDLHEDPKERRAQLQAEADKVRDLMIQMKKQIAEEASNIDQRKPIKKATWLKDRKTNTRRNSLVSSDKKKLDAA